MDNDGYKLIVDKKLDLEYELTGGCGLVQACGELAGIDIYFRAKYDMWSFDVADENGRLPSDGSDGKEGYYKECKYTGAGDMSLADAEIIIKKCINDYINKRNA